MHELSRCTVSSWRGDWFHLLPDEEWPVALHTQRRPLWWWWNTSQESEVWFASAPRPPPRACRCCSHTQSDSSHNKHMWTLLRVAVCLSKHTIYCFHLQLQRFKCSVILRALISCQKYYFWSRSIFKPDYDQTSKKQNSHTLRYSANISRLETSTGDEMFVGWKKGK